MSAKLKIKRGTTSAWNSTGSSIDTTLEPGQLGVEYLDDGNMRLKVGKQTADGSATAWSDLPYVTPSVSIVQATGQSEMAVMSQKAVSDFVFGSESMIVSDQVDKKRFYVVTEKGYYNNSGEYVDSPSYSHTPKIAINYIPKEVIDRLYSVAVWNGETFVRYAEAKNISSLNGVTFDNIVLNFMVSSSGSRYGVLIGSHIRIGGYELINYAKKINSSVGYTKSLIKSGRFGAYGTVDLSLTSYSHSGRIATNKIYEPVEAEPNSIVVWKNGICTGYYTWENRANAETYGYDEIAYNFKAANVPVDTEITIRFDSAKWDTRSAVFLGDSITYGAYQPEGGTSPSALADKPYCEIACELLNMKCINNGYSGTCISSAIYNSESHNTNSYNKRFAKLPDSDIVVIEGGTNDYGTRIPLGSLADLTAELRGNIQTVVDAYIADPNDNTKRDAIDQYDTSFYTGLYSLCYGLQNKFPTSRVVFITPIPRKKFNYETSPLDDYRSAIYDVARDIFGFAVIDGKTMGLSVESEIFKNTYISDGLHPTPAGHEIFGKNLARALNAV